MGQQCLKKDAVPSVFNWTGSPSIAQLARQKRAKKRTQQQDELHLPQLVNDEVAESVPVMEVEVEVEVDVEDAQPAALLDQQPTLYSNSTTVSTCTQTGGGLRLSVKAFYE